MDELLPKEVIAKILGETGALSRDKVSPLVTSVTHFKPFRIQNKPQEELDLAQFSTVFEQVIIFIQSDWRKSFVEGGTVSLRDSGVMNLEKFRLRESSLCVQLSVDDFSDAFLFYIQPETFYFILNSFFGGGSFKSFKTGGYLTDIELAVLNRICQSVASSFSRAFHAIFPTRFKVARVNVVNEDQYEFMRNDYMLLDFLLVASEVKQHFAYAIPASYLKYIKVQLSKRQGGELRKTDPHWQKTVTGTVLSSEVDIKIGMGALSIPFEKSINLKPGDVFPWDRQGPQVLVSIHDRPAMKGTIGVVGENYAVKVEDLLF